MPHHQAQSSIIHHRITRPWFLDKVILSHQTEDSILECKEKDFAKDAAEIIAQIKVLRNKIDGEVHQETFNRIINNINLVSKYVSDIAAYDYTILHPEILSRCQEIQRDYLTLPANVQQDSLLSTIGYKIAVICLFLIALSLSLILGEAFAALYYGFLSTELLVESLVWMMTIIGIPALSLGMFSYLVACCSDSQFSELDILNNDIHNFCDDAIAYCQSHAPEFEVVVEIEEEEEEEENRRLIAS